MTLVLIATATIGSSNLQPRVGPAVLVGTRMALNGGVDGLGGPGG